MFDGRCVGVGIMKKRQGKWDKCHIGKSNNIDDHIMFKEAKPKWLRLTNCKLQYYGNKFTHSWVMHTLPKKPTWHQNSGLVTI